MAERDENGRLKKGHGGLKPKGAVSQKTEMWHKLGDYVVTSGAQRAMEILSDMDDEDFLHYYLTMLEYFKPKQARQTIVGESDAPVQIVINDKL
jgi:hypothetical protein